MKTSDFDYVLPPDRIAQEPLPERDASRLLVLEGATGAVTHRSFRDLPGLLDPGDLLVLNDTRVFPARLHGRREVTGGRVEALFIRQLQRETHQKLYRELEDAKGGLPTREELWLALTRSGGTLRPGEPIDLADGRVRARIVERRGRDGDVLAVEVVGPHHVHPHVHPQGGEGGSDGSGTADVASLSTLLAHAGHMPVPPYVRRDRAAPPSELDRERYQTTYAREEGAIAAPTAGLHFSERVFEELTARGVRRTFVTLHVGPGTFRPIKSGNVESHVMDAERYLVPPGAAREIDECRERGGRLVAVGPTTVRTLESAAVARAPSDPDAHEGDHGIVSPGPGVATLFMTPGHEFRALRPGRDMVLTNFHMPKGTPLLLACGFAEAISSRSGRPSAGRAEVLSAYAEAIEKGYRFLSYGDAMLIA